MKILITGAGGFIGSHLAQRLAKEGNEVYGVDIKRPEFMKTAGQRFFLRDLRDHAQATQILTHVQPDRVYHLAANMGGIGFITQDERSIFADNMRIDLNVFQACQYAHVDRVLYASSACVYPEFLQMEFGAQLKEDDALPAFPDTLYGWEKLMSEMWLTNNRSTDVRIARFHNIYGTKGTWEGGREKAPAALCRKVAQAALSGSDSIEIDVWGNGRQERSFCYINDALDGITRLMESGYPFPLNIGSDKAVSIVEMIDIISKIAKVEVNVSFQLDKPVGVMSRNSDNTKTREILGWEPKTTLKKGLGQTYAWIKEQLEERARNG